MISGGAFPYIEERLNAGGVLSRLNRHEMEVRRYLIIATHHIECSFTFMDDNMSARSEAPPPFLPRLAPSDELEKKRRNEIGSPA